MEYTNRKSRNCDVSQKLAIPFLEVGDSSTILARFSRGKVDITMKCMANRFFDAALLHLDYLITHQEDGDVETLTILHNSFIALELSLKSIYSGLYQLKDEDWNSLQSHIETGHGLVMLIEKIRTSFSTNRLKESEKEWINDRLKLLEEYIAFTSERNLDFQSTRYPINRALEAFMYMKTEIGVDLLQLAKWIKILCRSCNDLFAIHDMLGGMQDAHPY